MSSILAAIILASTNPQPLPKGPEVQQEVPKMEAPEFRPEFVTAVEVRCTTVKHYHATQFRDAGFSVIAFGRAAQGQGIMFLTDPEGNFKIVGVSDAMTCVLAEGSGITVAE